MELLATKLEEGKSEDLQWIQILVPLRRLSLNGNVCGLCRCLRVGYSNEDLSLLDQKILLDSWEINSPKDYAAD